MCPDALALNRPTVFDGTDNIYNNLGANDETPAVNADAGDDEINTGLGNDMVEGGAGDDILSDHDGHDELFGQAGNDILISRHGGDILYGGGAFEENTCMDIAGGTDANGDDCGVYTFDPLICETANVPADPGPLFVSTVDCCACGGGELDATSMVADMDNDGEFCNTYVIYPTHEKHRHFDWTPINLNVGMTGDMAFTCTKICGMTLDDIIEFRLDDPDYEDHKYTDLDDTCAL